MEFLAENWVYIAITLLMVYMMSKGSGCCGVHSHDEGSKDGGCRGGEQHGNLSSNS